MIFIQTSKTNFKIIILTLDLNKSRKTNKIKLR